MKRVTQKVRAVRSKGAREHLDYNSAKHKADKQAADKLREAHWVRVPDAPRAGPNPFPCAEELAQVVIFSVRDNAGKTVKRVEGVSPEVYKAHLAEAAKNGSVWYVPTKQVKKNGQAKMQKRKGNGLHDCYFSCAPWVSERLAELVEEGKAEEVRVLSRKILNRARIVLENRTGYKVIGGALHPDSRGVLGYHLQFQTAADGQLLGRSAKGTKGGLRLAGDAMSSVARYSAFVEVADRFGVLGRDCDDIAINKAADARVEELLGPEEWAKVEAKAKVMAEAWKKRREEALASREEVADLKRQLEVMQGRIGLFVDACAAVLPPALFAAVNVAFDSALRGPTKPVSGPTEAVPAL